MITILMATYNGEKYLPKQIDSLLAQTFTDFTIWIQDDVSTDNTWQILKVYQKDHPEKIKITRRETPSGSAKNNFLDMITTARDDYIMLCDQDDFWLPNKIELTLVKMKEMEVANPSQPILVHTDLTVVDQNLQIIQQSFRISTNRDYNRKKYRHMFTINNASGCTIMYNRALADLLYVTPRYTMMHDWWLKLVATSFGKVGHIDQQTMLYRQHGENSLGAKDVRTLKYKFNRFLNWQVVRDNIHATCTQAASLLECYGDKLSPEQIDFLKQYSIIPSRNKLGRWYTICKLGAFMNGISRNIAYFTFV